MSATGKIVLVLEYLGTHYCGFQLQADQPTIQLEIERGIEKLTGEKSRIIGASRTDSGVHARGQVVSFRTGSSVGVGAFIGGLNYYLPRDIAVRAAYHVREEVNVRRDAVSREYRYCILNSATRSPLLAEFSYLVPGKLDTTAMHQAAQSLLGEHDLISFATSLDDKKRKTVRRVYRAEVTRQDEIVAFTIVANSFLPHQVRNTVGSLVRVGQGKMQPDEFRSIIEAKQAGLAGPAAPACGLCLIRVNYPYSFEEKDENV